MDFANSPPALVTYIFEMTLYELVIFFFFKLRLS